MDTQKHLNTQFIKNFVREFKQAFSLFHLLLAIIILSLIFSCPAGSNTPEIKGGIKDDTKGITSFKFYKTNNNDYLERDVSLTIDKENKRITGFITNSSITNLIPTIKIGVSNDSISPESGVAQDFSKEVTYTITDSDKTTVKYTVSITKLNEVIFNTNGGAISNALNHIVVVSNGDLVTPPDDPTQQHYGFKGWYTNEEGESPFDVDNTPITEKTTLYAQWTNKQYRIEFYIDGTFTNSTNLDSLSTIPDGAYPLPSEEGLVYAWFDGPGLKNIYPHMTVTNHHSIYTSNTYTIGKTIYRIIAYSKIPDDLNTYSNLSQTVFSNYTPGARVTARYVKTDGTGDGTSWANAINDLQSAINGINDVSTSHVYVVLVASGPYTPQQSYSMKNQVAIVGGFDAGTYDRTGETRLDGSGARGVFNNNGLDKSAILYGVTITNGSANQGGGMYNTGSSPTLIGVTFSSNTATGAVGSGGGMYNTGSSPTLIGVTFSGNRAIGQTAAGGGMYNDNSSPILLGVTFSKNMANYGGGMYNYINSSPTLIGVTFSGNTGNTWGGGMLNQNSSPTLIGVTFVSNTGSGGMVNNVSSPILFNVLLWGNSGGNIYLHNSTTNTEYLTLHYSLIEGGLTSFDNATGVRLYTNNINTNPIEIKSSSIITGNPKLDSLGLANNGGRVRTISIAMDSPAKDAGAYVRGVKTGNTYAASNLYYSSDTITWYRASDNFEFTTLPEATEDLTATDARGYGRDGRPDIGAYEVGGTP